MESGYWYRTYVGSFILSLAMYYLVVGIYDIASWNWLFDSLGGQNYQLFTVSVHLQFFIILVNFLFYRM